MLLLSWPRYSAKSLKLAGWLQCLPLPEEHPNTVNSLCIKRSETAGKIELHNREIERLWAALIHVDALLRLFILTPTRTI